VFLINALLTGNRLYADNRVFLRELIQNAVDACRLRKRLEPAHDPAISIRFNNDISIVTVRDNGIGMDRQWIEKYFQTIGISLYQ
jgi:HSP90 family molecular chaperone